MDSIKKIVKRDGRTVDFDVNKIADNFQGSAGSWRQRQRNVYVPGKTG